MRKDLGKNLRIYIDHGEAYGNMGDEAMLFCAMARINKELRDCDFIVPRESGQPLPTLPPRTQYVTSLRHFFRILGRAVRIFLKFKGYIYHCVRKNPEEREISELDIWKIVDNISRWLIPLIAIFPTRIAKSIHEMKNCDVLYTVGAATLNDFNLRDITYRTWCIAYLSHEADSVLYHHRP